MRSKAKKKGTAIPKRAQAEKPTKKQKAKDHFAIIYDILNDSDTVLEEALDLEALGTGTILGIETGAEEMVIEVARLAAHMVYRLHSLIDDERALPFLRSSYGKQIFLPVFASYKTTDSMHKALVEKVGLSKGFPLDFRGDKKVIDRKKPFNSYTEAAIGAVFWFRGIWDTSEDYMPLHHWTSLAAFIISKNDEHESEAAQLAEAITPRKYLPLWRAIEKAAADTLDLPKVTTLNHEQWLKKAVLPIYNADPTESKLAPAHTRGDRRVNRRARLEYDEKNNARTPAQVTILFRAALTNMAHSEPPKRGRPRKK